MVATLKKISKYRYLELEDVQGDDMWFASDFHFDHANIIRIGGRPFATDISTKKISRLPSLRNTMFLSNGMITAPYR